MKQAIPYVLIAVNTVIVTAFALEPYVLISALPILGIACALLAYASIRRRDSVLKRDLLLIASVFLFPLLLVFSLFVFALICAKLGLLGYSTSIGVPSLLAYYWLPTYVGIAYLLVASVLLGIAWSRGTSSTLAKVFLVAYTMTLLVYIGYVVWWHATGQKWDYI
jgi:hypothetical protein